MPKFKVKFDWSGYSRGYSVYEVEAENAEIAKETFYDGEKVKHEVVRDDTKRDEIEVEEIK